MGLIFSALWDQLELLRENRDWTLPSIVTLSVGLYVNALVNGYLEEFVNFDKI